MRTTVIGLGYLGLVHAATLAEMGNAVIGMDIDTRKVDRIKLGLLPFHEPQLDELVSKHVASGKLQFTSNIIEAAKFANNHFICVGTPITPAGLPDLHYIFEAVESLAPHFKGPENFIYGKSTTPPGTAAKLLRVAKREAPEETFVDIAWNPEFLREGNAVNDSLYPSRLVFGINYNRTQIELRAIYNRIIQSHCQPIITDVETAEMAKLASNGFLATKISYINGIAQFCEQNGGNVKDIAKIMGADPRIGHVGLQPGLGFGGGCLPKDLQMLTQIADDNHARRLGRLLRFAQVINHSRREQVLTLATELLHGVEGQNIAVLGLAFKPGTDDMRESPGLYLAHALSSAGAHVITHDPIAGDAEFNHTDKAEDAIRDRDLVIIATDHPEYGKLDPSQFTPSKIIDGRYTLNRKKWETAGWEYHEVGR